MKIKPMLKWQSGVLLLACLMLATWAQAQTQAETDWAFLQNLAPDEGLESDFGLNMAIADDLIVVGWPKIYEQTDHSDECGEVRIYQKIAGQYQEIQRLTAADGLGTCLPGDGFGLGLAYDEGYLAVGLPEGTKNSLFGLGSGQDADSKVLIFQRVGEQFTWMQTLSPYEMAPNHGMGLHIAMESGKLAILEHAYETVYGYTFASNKAVQIFESNDGVFSATGRVTGDIPFFGLDFDFDGDQLIVGSFGEQMINSPGQVDIFTKQNGQWQRTQTIRDENNENLGAAISADQGMMAVGAVAAGGHGSVSIFVKNDAGIWSLSDRFYPPDSELNDQYGNQVHIKGDELAVGATNGDDVNYTSGAVYTYRMNEAGEWALQQRLTAALDEAHDFFGGVVLFDHEKMLVSAPSGKYFDGDNSAFYVYSREGEAPSDDNGDDNPDDNGDDTSSETVSIDARLTGIWSIDHISQESLLLEMLDDNQVLMYWLGFDANGKQLWLYGLGQISGDSVSFDDVYQTSGPVFGAAYDSSQLSQSRIGDASLSLNSCGNGQFQYDFNGLGQASRAIEKAYSLKDNDCGKAAKVVDSGMSGAWFNPERNGEGFYILVYQNEEGLRAYTYWLSYNDQGEPIWMIGASAVQQNNLVANTVVIPTGNQYGVQGSDGIDVQGSMTIQYTGCQSANVEFDLEQGGLGAGGHSLFRLSQPVNSYCNLSK